MSKALKESLCERGAALMEEFCKANGIPLPELVRLEKTDRYYYLGSCAFYRPTTINIAVEKCAANGFGGRAWSWPSYSIDRTPYGVIQHELGHHVDHVKTNNPLKVKADLFSYVIHGESGEAPLTGYLGTDDEDQTFYKEWFAENFRLFVTNPDLCRLIRPKFCMAMCLRFKPVIKGRWEDVLIGHGATDRIILQAAKKIEDVGVGKVLS